MLDSDDEARKKPAEKEEKKASPEPADSKEALQKAGAVASVLRLGWEVLTFFNPFGTD